MKIIKIKNILICVPGTLILTILLQTLNSLSKTIHNKIKNNITIEKVKVKKKQPMCVSNHIHIH